MTSGLERPHLLGFFRGSTHSVNLPDEGPFTIGSAQDADWTVDVPQVRHVHARFRVTDGQVLLSGEGEAVEWKLTLNGRPLTDIQPLLSGDTVTIGPLTVVFQDRRRARRKSLPLDAALLRERLAEEIARCGRTRRNLAVAVLQVEELAEEDEPAVLDVLRSQTRKVDLVGRLQLGEYVILMPETDARALVPADRILRGMGDRSATARLGIAMCPADASLPDALLTGARQAARAASPGTVLAVSSQSGLLTVKEWSLVTVEPALQRLVALVRQLAPSELPVLLAGETGVGKEVFASVLHHWSGRGRHPLVTINCAALTPTLFESELFGHEKGAFTGADKEKPGLLETADQGTVLLDEIGECPMALQAKLLRVLETRRFCRVGGLSERSVDVRILAATNRDLEAEVTAGRFRKDLYFRITTACLTIPALRHRPLDIPALARLLLSEACDRNGREALRLTPEAVRRLVLHNWPGNIRELRNVMEYCAATVTGEVLHADALPEGIARTTAPWLARAELASSAPTDGDVGPFEERRFATLREEVKHLERTRIIQALALCDGVQNQAARLLGMPLRTFVSRLKEYEIPRPSRRSTRGA